MTTRVDLKWPDDLVQAIDEQRDGEARSAWLRDAAQAKLEGRQVERPSSRPRVTAENCAHLGAIARGLALCDVCGARL